MSDELLTRALARAAAESAQGGASPLTSWSVTGPPQRTRSGMTVVHLQQRHAGIPVRGCLRSVRFDALGEITRLTGEVVTLDPVTPIRPVAPVRAAVYLACRHLADEVLAETSPELARRVSNRRPRILAEADGPEAATALTKVPFEGSIRASLVILPESSDLMWDVRLQLPAAGGAYSVLVDAAAAEPEVLSVDRLTAHAVSGRVLSLDPQAAPVDAPFPLPRADYPPFDGRPIPRPQWCAGDKLEGNNVVCVDDRGRGMAAAPAGNGLRFEAADPRGIHQAMIDAFYLCNFLHDFFLLLGFDESLGNFQKENSPGAGRGGDPLRVVVWDAEILGAAFFLPQPDGAMAELNLGRVGTRHTALDASVVIHEFTHGVTSRIIGGPDVANPLTRPQSRALGEGFSDYFALTILNRERRRLGLPRTNVYGGWVASRDGEPPKATGLRNFAYDRTFTGTYGDLGERGFEKDHDAGMVWCAALLEAHEVLAMGEETDAGDERAWEVVFDAIRLLHPGDKGPTFLHARDAVLSVFDADVTAGRLPNDAALRQRLADAFTRRGMGPGARSPNAGYKQIQEDLGSFGGGG